MDNKRIERDCFNCGLTEICIKNKAADYPAIEIEELFPGIVQTIKGLSDELNREMMDVYFPIINKALAKECKYFTNRT